MSIATEIERLLQAKADLKISIEAKGVSLADDATLDDYPEAVDQIQTGGGASNIVQGSFIFNESGSKTLSIPYEGNGHAVLIFIRVKDGLENSDFTQLIANYACDLWLAVKSNPTKNWSDSNTNRATRYFTVYKSSATSAYKYSTASNVSQILDTGSAHEYAGSIVAINPSEECKELYVYMRDSSYGFVPGIEYEYTVVFSE